MSYLDMDPPKEPILGDTSMPVNMAFNARIAEGLLQANKEITIKFDEIVEVIDWDRVLIQAYAQHLKVHHNGVSLDQVRICGECIKTVLLRRE